MSFSAFSSFLQKLAFQHSKSQLKNLPFVSVFSFSASQLKKPAEKQKQTGTKYSRNKQHNLKYNYNKLI
jgi:hypothetical protein